MDRSKQIFGNILSEKAYKKSVKTKQKYLKKFGADSQAEYALGVVENPVLAPFIGVKNITTQNTSDGIPADNGLIVGNIRMGYGHYRISMAIASAAHSMGYTPYWFDLHSFSETTGGKVISHLNALYSLGSKLSQKYSIFNQLYWEPLNSEGFKRLSYNAMDQKVSELMTPIFNNLPKDMPFVATHAWPAQAAVHAGVKRVVNAIPDNWPMALHLSEGAIHTVQTPSSFLGYMSLKNMDGHKILNPIPEGEIFDVGHYIDHELVSNITVDCSRRLERIKNRATKRILITVGGAGAQKEILVQIIKDVLPFIKNQKVALFINAGDHQNVWESLTSEIPELSSLAEKHFDEWEKTCEFAAYSLDHDVKGIHAFYHKNIFAAVYATNLLMRSCDILVTKPSELAFYPVPKLMIKRVGGHEAWGAIRTAEVGDGSIECENTGLALQMLRLMLERDEILASFSHNILKAHSIGIYNGAYRVVELATQEKALNGK